MQIQVLIEWRGIINRYPSINNGAKIYLRRLVITFNRYGSILHVCVVAEELM